jgi:hypothetical protein
MTVFPDFSTDVIKLFSKKYDKNNLSVLIFNNDESINRFIISPDFKPWKNGLG